jgi:hypothetical protein
MKKIAACLAATLLILCATCLLILFSATTTFGQSFEGKVIYKHSYKSKSPGLRDDQLLTMMGSTEDYFIKGGAYKAVTNGTMMQWTLYSNTDNKVYSKLSNSETVFWTDGSVNTDAVLKSELNKGVVTLLGYPCDELILTCRSGIQKYYFNQKIPVSLSLYTAHKYGNWYDYLSQAHALPLKTIISNAQFEMEETAIEVTPMKLEAQFFKLPENVKTAKSPY